MDSTLKFKEKKAQEGRKKEKPQKNVSGLGFRIKEIPAGEDNQIKTESNLQKEIRVIKIIQEPKKEQPKKEEPQQLFSKNNKEVFGSNLEHLKKIEIKDIGKVPYVLEYLKEQLKKTSNDYKELGVLKNKGNPERMENLKKLINQNQRFPSKGLHFDDIAELIKDFIKEIPNGLVPEKCLLQICKKEETVTCFQEFNNIEKENQAVLIWLTKLMIDVIQNEYENFMDLQITSTEIAPIIFHNEDEKKKKEIKQAAQFFLYTLCSHWK